VADGNDGAVPPRIAADHEGVVAVRMPLIGHPNPQRTRRAAADQVGSIRCGGESMGAGAQVSLVDGPGGKLLAIGEQQAFAIWCERVFSEMVHMRPA